MIQYNTSISWYRLTFLDRAVCPRQMISIDMLMVTSQLGYLGRHCCSQCSVGRVFAAASYLYVVRMTVIWVCGYLRLSIL